MILNRQETAASELLERHYYYREHPFEHSNLIFLSYFSDVFEFPGSQSQQSLAGRLVETIG